MDEKTRIFFETHEKFPKWICDDNKDTYGFEISWRLPEIYKKHADKIWRCPKLIEQIVEKCKLVLNSGQFDIDIVNLSFDQRGLTIDVYPGDACGVYPDSNGKSYSCHNVDSPRQCFSLYFFLITALDEIFKMIAMWEDNHETGLVGHTEVTSFRLQRSLASKPYKLWEIKDWDLKRVGVAFARTNEEAEDVASGVLGKNECQSPISTLNKPRFLSPFSVFEIEVIFEGDFPPKTYKVIADSSYDAKEIVEENLERQPALSPVKEIKVKEKGEPIQPIILNKVGG